VKELFDLRRIVCQLTRYAVHVGGTGGTRQFGLDVVATRVRYEMQRDTVALKAGPPARDQLHRIIGIIQSHAVGNPVFFPRRRASRKLAHDLSYPRCDTIHSRGDMRALVPVLALLVTACSQVNRGANAPATEIPADTAVARVHERMLTALGGREAWQRARYMAFDFVVVRDGRELTRRSHRWDRHRGDYRLRWTSGSDTVVAVFNVNDVRAGAVQVNGQEVTGAREDSLLTTAYARHINDSYWLIMPYKWLDPGVTLTSQGRQTDAQGRAWDVVKLTFANVGLTPQNEYLAFVSPETGLMERWHHFPRAGAQPAIYDWNKWQRFGPIMLATEKPSPDGATVIRFDNVRVETSVPQGAFYF
jgi:hypothetical protein